jgi:hypothetical protein
MSDFFKKRPSEMLYDEINEKIGDTYPHVMKELKDILEENQ